MGQGFSSGNSIYLQVDRAFYSPGEQVNGFVAVNVVKPFQANAVVLRVEGYEASSWEEREENRNYDNEKNEWITDYITRNHSGSRDFFKIKVPLATYPQQLMPGQYQYGFSFMLPNGLPGSFDYEGSGQQYYRGNQVQYLKAKIRYKVKAECEVPGMLTSNLRYKQHLLLHERMQRPPSQVVVEDRQSVNACCCCGKGAAWITAHVEKDSYFPGEVANALLQVTNESTADFSHVTLSLHRIITLRTDGVGFYEVDEKLAESSSPGVRAGDKLTGDATRRLSLQLPPNLQSTALGSLVRCEYRLYVKLKASSFMNDPCVKLPITIYQAPPAYNPYLQPPPYWQPQVSVPPITVALPSAPPMPPGGQVMGMPASNAPPGGAYQAPQPVYGGPPQ